MPEGGRMASEQRVRSAEQPRGGRAGTGLRVLLGSQPDGQPASTASHDQRQPPRLRLFGLSFLMLFVELALIRWTGAKIVYLSYFSNFVLLGSFLGIGIGFLRSRSRVNLFAWAPVALALLVL